MQSSVSYHMLEALPAGITRFDEGYTVSPMPNPSPFLKGTIKDASPGGRNERLK